LLLRQNAFRTFAAETAVGDNLVPAVLRIFLRHHRQRRQIGDGARRRIEVAQSPGVKRRPLGCVAQQHSQPLISMKFNTFALPIQACDVIFHRRLDRMKVRRAHAFVLHNVPITIFRVDTAYYPIVNFSDEPP